MHKVRIAARAYYCAVADGCSDITRTNLRVHTEMSWHELIP
ncbi:hypothetical protein ACMHYB_03185 [Sorangium sp. So ce1128]